MFRVSQKPNALSNVVINFEFSVSVLSWTDLIVGAPNFFDRKAEIGGAVYVYLNPFGHWDDQARPIRLNGTYDSMFGMAVGNIGDLDQDGYGGENLICLHTNHHQFYLHCNIITERVSFC